MLSANLRKSIAVLGFRNVSKREETAWLSTALPEMLATELSAGEKLRIISAEQVARMERDLSLTETDTLASDTLKRVHNYGRGQSPLHRRRRDGTLPLSAGR